MDEVVSVPIEDEVAIRGEFRRPVLLVLDIALEENRDLGVDSLHLCQDLLYVF